MPYLIFSKQLQSWFEVLSIIGVKTYCTFSLDSCPSSLAALKMSWVPWKRQKDRRKVDRGREESIVIIMTKQGSGKRLSVTQRTATYLTHTFINSKPLYRCQGTFSFKCCYHTYLCFTHSKTLHSAAQIHAHTEWDMSVGREGKVFQLVVRASKRT